MTTIPRRTSCPTQIPPPQWSESRNDRRAHPRCDPGASARAWRQLTEAQLCEVFGVKRGPIRQALAQLATDHLVDLEPNRGAFVASPSLQEVHEVFEMRRIIDWPWSKRFAAVMACAV